MSLSADIIVKFLLYCVMDPLSQRVHVLNSSKDNLSAILPGLFFLKPECFLCLQLETIPTAGFSRVDQFKCLQLKDIYTSQAVIS